MKPLMTKKMSTPKTPRVGEAVAAVAGEFFAAVEPGYEDDRNGPKELEGRRSGGGSRAGAALCEQAGGRTEACSTFGLIRSAEPCFVSGGVGAVELV